MADRLTDEERAAIDAALAIISARASKARQAREPAAYPARVAHGVVTREQSFPRTRPQPTRGPMPVQTLLEWAFRREGASLELPDRRTVEERGSGFGMEYVLIERARLGGVQIDTSIGRSEPHEDAETVAAIVSGLPEDLGGIRMAITVAEIARAGMTPDWMPGATPHLVPITWTARNLGKTEVIGRETIYRTVVDRRRGARTFKSSVEIRFTPCRWSPDPATIEHARSGYSDWWVALDYLRDAFSGCRMLTTVGVTGAMPPRTPWDRT